MTELISDAKSEISQATKLIRDTTERQMRAAKPDLSAWVSANAGSGKTHVLSQRVIRLLLGKTRPSSILCLTYTKAAAAEMSNRVFKTLSNWTQLSDDDLKKQLEKFEGYQTSDENLKFARTLFASALETPGGLKVQTIHAFCEALLHRFPLEANVSGHFEVLDDVKATALIAQCRNIILNNVARGHDETLISAINHILDHAGEHGLEELFSELVSERAKLSDYMNFAHANGGVDACLSSAFDIDPSHTIEDILSDIWPLPNFDENRIFSFSELAHSGKNKSPKDMATCLTRAQHASTDHEKLDILKSGFLTKAGAPRSLKNTVSKAMQDVEPLLIDQLGTVQDHILALDDKLRRKLCFELTKSALVLAEKFIKLFEDFKRKQSRLDYDDLILKTAHLLKKGGAGSWVNYKLDQGIDHILVDEAQDTSPNQWSVIQSLADEFSSGLALRDQSRTIFAVGDEKQSIYSFQGARPERFDQERRETSKRIQSAQKQFESIALRVSFRSTPEILEMVDHVFDHGEAKEGLSFSEDVILHHTVRDNAPGCVELWDMIAKQSQQNSGDWLASIDAVSELDPINQLSQQIASVLEDWVGVETIVDQKSGKNRFIRAGDILILVRKRDAFVPTLMRTLKTKTNIAVAGTDRLRLTDHISIQDLLALAKLILLKEDDLSLAGILKSPLFNISEDKLFELCAKRRTDQSIWAALKLRAQQDDSWQLIEQRLEQLTALTQQHTVHDFYSHLLGPMGIRQTYLDTMGTEVTDILDGFLDAALDHDQSDQPGLQNFIIAMEQTNPEIKREQEQDVDAVRIMTVHASKGLEAPIVFLVDPGSAAFHSSHGKSILEVAQPDHKSLQPNPFIWVPSSSVENSISSELKKQQEKLTEQEYKRLLYVGMTRAADRLIVCGYRGTRAPKKPTWHQFVEDGFNRADPEMIREIDRQTSDISWTVRAYSHQLKIASDLDENASAGNEDAQIKRPKCLDENIKPSAKLPRPLTPSGVNVTIEDTQSLSKNASPFDKATEGPANSLLYGNAVHRLMQVLPQIEPDQRRASAANYLKNALSGQSEQHEDMINQVENILNNPEWAPVFGSQSAAEFSVMGNLILGGETRSVFGRIDRLVILPDRILILDYKTNLQVPARITDIPGNYIAQLAIYRQILRPLYDDRPVEAVLLYTRGPKMYEISEQQMDDAMDHLCSK